MDKNIKEMIEYPKEGILSKEILKNENQDVSLFCIAKRSEIGEHTSAKQGFVYVITSRLYSKRKSLFYNSEIVLLQKNWYQHCDQSKLLNYSHSNLQIVKHNSFAE